MFHSIVRNYFDLDTWKEDLIILHSVSIFLMYYHWKLGKSTAQFYTALSDNLLGCSVSATDSVLHSKPMFSHFLFMSMRVLFFLYSLTNVFLNFYGGSKADLFANHDKMICQDDYKAIAITD